jgi:hypothetical protein
MPGRWATLPDVTLLSELDAFYLDHRRCGELDAGVDGPVVWFDCACGGAHGQASGRGRRCRLSCAVS